MSVIRVTHPRLPFAQVPHAIVEDPDLSWKAKGIYSYLIGRPPGWSVNRTDLVRRSIDGKSGLQSGIRELQVQGWLRITQTREGGRITGTIWELIVPGVEGSPYADFQDTVKQDTEIQDMENRTTYQESSSKQEGDDQQSLVARLWDVYVDVTGLSRLQLTQNRSRRLRNVWAFIKKAESALSETDVTEDQLFRIWRVMVSLLWGDPWRQLERSRHDPYNVLRSPEQIEGWYIKARDHIGAQDHSQANRDRDDEKVEQQRAQDAAQEERHEMLRQFYQELNEEGKAEVEALADQIQVRDFPDLGEFVWVRRVCVREACVQISRIDSATSTEKERRAS